MISHYYTKQGGSVSWELPLIIFSDEPKLPEEKQPISEEAIRFEMAKGFPMSRVCHVFGKTLEDFKILLDELGIEYELQSSQIQNPVSNSLRFDEVEMFKSWLESNGYDIVYNDDPKVLFRVRVGGKPRSIKTVNKKLDGTTYINMGIGVPGLYKKWKGIQ